MQGIPRDQPPLRSLEVFLHHHPLEEEGEKRQAGAAHADGVRRHLALEQSGRRVPADATVDIKQGVALAVVLPQECHHRLAGVHWAPDRGGPEVVEEVGSPGEG